MIRLDEVVLELDSFDEALGTFGAVFEEWYDRSVATVEREDVLRVE